MMEKNNTDFVFLGGMFPKELEKEIIEDTKANLQQAANLLQWNLINGLETSIGKKMHLVSAVYIGTFPQYYKKLWIRSQKWSHSNKCQDDFVGFVNLFGIKEIIRKWGVKQAGRRVVRQSAKGALVIFVYAINSALLEAAISMKKKAKGRKVHVCLICPDLPQYMNMGDSRGKIFQMLKKVDRRKQQKLLKQLDSFVFVTKYMNEVINQGGKPWCVVEGIAEDTGFICEEKKGKEKIVLYSGGICEAYGVYELLRIFKEPKEPGWKLCLCGYAEKEIQKKYDSEYIEFLGILPNEEVRRLQRKADILVNPRCGEEEYVRYSFPSKTMEYMSSGTPVLMYELVGVPEEYFSYVYTVEKNGNDLEKALLKLMREDSSKLEEQGKKAREFVMKHKNAVVQGEKIVKMIVGENE